MEFEKEFSITIPQEDTGNIETVGNVIDYLAEKLPE